MSILRAGRAGGLSRLAATPATALTGEQWAELDNGIVFAFYAKTPNPLNGSMGTTIGGRRARAARSRGLRDQARAETLEAIGRRQLSPPFVVEFARNSRGRLDDDGLRGALKNVRDGIADALGIDDGDEGRLRFVYSQAPNREGKPAVSVRIRMVGREPAR